MNKKQRLEQQIRALRDELEALEAVEQIKLNEKYVGKCFKYRNCYSCPETEEDYWYLYQTVLDVNKHGELEVFGFQIDKYNNIEIKPKRNTCPYLLGEEISQEEFNEAWKKVEIRVQNYSFLWNKIIEE